LREASVDPTAQPANLANSVANSVAKSVAKGVAASGAGAEPPLDAAADAAPVAGQPPAEVQGKGEADADDDSASSLRVELGTLARALLASPVGKALAGLSAAVFLVVAATAYWQIRLNSWNKPFFDAMSRRDMPGFMVQLGIFCVIAVTLTVLNVAQRWLVETLKIKLRQGLVGDLLHGWMQPRRAFWLANSGNMGVNPDQRMHEDARKLCELSADLGAGLLQASILLVTFAGVLWVLSRDFSVRVADRDWPIPGFMLWAAIAYAAIGSLLSYRVGHSLIRRNAERYAREAELRFSLVRINEHLDGISLAAGEADERRRVEIDLADVLAATGRLVTGLTNLTWITAGFGWVTLVAPILVAAPLYFTGKISFGGLMMAASAFTQAQSSLRWFVDNFSVIADWRATLLRVANFRLALNEAGAPPEFGTRIEYAEGAAGTLAIEGLRIVSSAGADELLEKQVLVRAGERVLIIGTPGTGKSLLFRALAGLWPWGSGSITRPKDESIHYLPRGTPYLPRGTLREVLAYPHAGEQFTPTACTHALEQLGLTRLAPMLEQARRWDRELSQDEQLSLAFARILLQAPGWVVIDDTFGALDDEVHARVAEVFTGELAHTALIHVGRAGQARDPLFTRVLHLVKAEDVAATTESAIEPTPELAPVSATFTAPGTAT
jgi:putative ATP-binding cassette transporter